MDLLLVLIELFRWVLRLRRYRRKLIENRGFARGGSVWVSIRRIFTHNGHPQPIIILGWIARFISCGLFTWYLYPVLFAMPGSVCG